MNPLCPGPLAVEKIDNVKKTGCRAFSSPEFSEMLPTTPFELQRCLEGFHAIYFSFEKMKLTVYFKQACTSTLLSAGDIKLSKTGACPVEACNLVNTMIICQYLNDNNPEQQQGSHLFSRVRKGMLIVSLDSKKMTFTCLFMTLKAGAVWC